MSLRWLVGRSCIVHSGSGGLRSAAQEHGVLLIPGGHWGRSHSCSSYPAALLFCLCSFLSALHSPRRSQQPATSHFQEHSRKVTTLSFCQFRFMLDEWAAASHGSSEEYCSWHHANNECKQMRLCRKRFWRGEKRLLSFSSGGQLESSDPPSPYSHAASSLLRSTSSICWATQETQLQGVHCSTWVACVSHGLQAMTSKNCSPASLKELNH